ncbi:hypothetical protein BV25DRAFT_1829808 [Artomyces pyxidatus]|uniref:Uncharacterized protein n=1 Tax=Artomyces pyxidatus TaxID=48021 RepID=A0ACB8SS78_9AGAM|nr:hypothetical protein BV25DRAFT_1829808 [Artomyces pyxidatus]
MSGPSKSRFRPDTMTNTVIMNSSASVSRRTPTWFPTLDYARTSKNRPQADLSSLWRNKGSKIVFAGFPSSPPFSTSITDGAATYSPSQTSGLRSAPSASVKLFTVTPPAFIYLSRGCWPRTELLHWLFPPSAPSDLREIEVVGAIRYDPRGRELA